MRTGSFTVCTEQCVLHLKLWVEFEFEFEFGFLHILGCAQTRPEIAERSSKTSYTKTQ